MARKPQPHAQTVRPWPEIVAPGPAFEIVPVPVGGNAHCIARCSLSLRSLHVPLDSSPASRAIRLHELGHLQFSPAPADVDCDALNITRESMLACEDARVNALISRFPVGARCLNRGRAGRWSRETRTVIETAPPKFAVLQALACARWGSAGAAADRLLAARDGRLARIARAAFILLQADRFSFAGTVAAARYIDATFAVATAASAPEPAADGNLQYGTMTTECPPLTIPISPPALARRWRATDTGTYLRNPHRLTTDGAIFARRTRLVGGAILVDCSGSMYGAVAEVESLLTTCPAATVALYSGAGDTGTLRIVASGGRRAEDLEWRPPDAGGNTIDGPALAWLASQPGPRLWVSDGEVTGIGDKQTPTLKHNAAAYCTAHNIVRRRYVPANETLAILRGEVRS